MPWIYDSKLQDPYEQQIYKKIFRLTKSKELALKASKNLGLFNYLKNNKFNSSEELQESIFLSKNQKLFSKEDSKKVFDFFNTLPLKGGAEGENAFDALIERWLSFMFYLMPNVLQESINYIEPFMFPLKSLENQTIIPGVGEGLGFAVDVIAQNNKLAAKLAQQYTPMIMGLAPIPEASTVGIIVGYMISSMFIFFNMLIFVSRHHFGEAFTQSLALFPFIGLAMQNVAESGEKIIEKFAAKRQKLINQLKTSTLFQPLGSVIENYTFDPLYEGNPQEDAEKLKSTISQNTNMLSDNFTALKDRLSNPDERQNLLDSAKLLGQQKFNELKSNPEIQSKLNMAKEKIDQLKSQPQFQNLKNTLKNKLNNTTNLVKAGKRLSKMKNNKVKQLWKTMKKSNK
jgi:hypothetical protein